MRRLLSVCLLVLLVLSGVAQEKHFIFIQADNKQIFNVSLNGRLYSSNASGYVIIPRLSDGDYNLIVGFPPNTFPDQAFKCMVNKKDLGFALKNFGEKGWGLFNLQQLDITYAGGSTDGKVVIPAADEPISFDKKPTPKSVEKPVEKAVETPVEKPVEQPVAKMEKPLANDSSAGSENKLPEAKTPETVSNLPDTATVEPTETISYREPTPKEQQPATEVSTTGNTTETPATTEVVQPSNSIVKLKQKKSKEGMQLSYQEVTDGQVDTIQVIIPLAEKESRKKKQKVDSEVATQDSATDARVQELNQRKDDVTFLEIDMNAGKETAAKSDDKPKAETPKADETVATPTAPAVVTPTPATDVATTTPPSEEPVKSVPKSTELCAQVATDNDYVKLRRKMAMENSDDRMIREAKKSFKDKCFDTKQMKGLSSLFLSDEGRFRFLSAAYSFVSDPAEFKLLQTEFIDPFYANRFKSLVE